jgi:Tn3 transposase DDE domain
MGDPFVPQRYRASGLNLTIAAIALWNTIYLGHAVAELRAQSETLPDKLLAHIAPLGWEHIGFNGDYIWASQPLKQGFRPLRNPRSAFLDAA